MDLEIPDAPEGVDFDAVKEHVENLDNRIVEVGVEHSDGFEYKASGEGLDHLQEIVDKNDSVRFDNPARAEAGHAYGMLLPTDR